MAAAPLRAGMPRLRNSGSGRRSGCCGVAGEETTVTLLMRRDRAGLLAARLCREWASYLKEKSQQVVDRVSGVIPVASVTAGVSLPAESPLELGEKYRQAKLAARVAEAIMGPGSLACWSDVEPYYLLAGQADRWADVCRRVLGPLAERGEEGEVLLLTLRTYLACGGNAAEAARRLFVHRNTLYYRLRRLRALLHRDLDDPHERFLLELVLRCREMIGRIPT